MNKFLYTLIVFSLFFFLQTTYAQRNVNFEILGIPDGLSNNQVWDVTQDKYGFLWIATADGLNRYDGYKFKIYKNDPDNLNSLPSNLVRTVLSDTNGVIWVGTDNGLSKYDYKTETFTNYYVDSTLASNSRIGVFGLYEDSENNLWLCLSSGIAKFNKGKDKIETCSIMDNGKIVPTAGISFTMLENSAGDLYSGLSYFGPVVFNKKNNYFEKLEINSGANLNIPPGNALLSLHEDKAGRMWIAYQSGLLIYDPQTKNLRKKDLFTPDTKTQNRNANAYTSLFEDEKGSLWVSTVNHGIYVLNLKTEEVFQFTQKDFPNISFVPVFFRFYKDSFNILWSGTLDAGLFKIDFQKEPFKVYSNFSKGTADNQSDLSTTAIYHDDKNDLTLLGTRSGLIDFKPDGNNKHYTHSDNNKNSIGHNRIFYITPGTKNNIWIGTRLGLSDYNIKNKSFTNYTFSKQNYHSTINYDFVGSVMLDDYGNLWLGTTNGLVKFNPASNSKLFIPGFDSKTYDNSLYKLIDSLYNNNKTIAGITRAGDYQDSTKEFSLEKKTNVLLVSVGEGLSTFGQADYGWLENSNSDIIWKEDNFFKTFYLGGGNKNRIAIELLKLDKGNYKLRYNSDESHSYGSWNVDPPSDSLWWGVQAFQIDDDFTFNKYSKILDDCNNSPFVNGNFVSTLAYDKSGAIWLGTDLNVSKYDIRQNKITNLKDLNPKAAALEGKTINKIYIDSKGIIWIAAELGLGVYDPKKNEFKIFIDKDGLPSNYIRSIEEDLYGNLWLSSVNGITKYNKDLENPIFINYDVKDGLQGYVFNSHSSYKSESGELYFGGQNGFNSFYPGNINKQPPKVVISELRISNNIINAASDNSPLTKSIFETNNITLSYGQNDISFEFNGIHFSRPEKNQYAYKLEGFDNDNWVYDNRRFATYTNLSPGDYVFKVKASNGDGIWNEEGRSMKITVLPPWWRTYWAYIGYFFIFAGIVFGIDRIQRRRLLAKERAATAIKEAELRAAAAEAQSRAVQAENERKTKELEEARELQLSMLPKTLPELPNLDIAVYMKTATEVGGDYYDFHIGLDGTLTAVLGDATGHGMKAGTMVTAAKSLFNSYAPNPDILFTFSEMTRCIKLMQMHMLSMCMTMLKLQGNKLLMSCAGMPPIFIYRKESRTIEEHVIKGMPLGAFNNFPYQLKETELAPGDTIMLMSDGFPELMNKEKELLGYKQVRNLFENVAEKEPDEIITYLKEEGDVWTNSSEPDDDITFVVMKMK